MSRNCHTQMIHLLLCLLSLSFLWLCGSSSSILSEYISIETDVEYYPSSGSSIIGQLNNIQSFVECTIRCMQNDQCFTATFYSLSQICSLFSERGAPTVPSINESATVITMINRFPSQCSSYMTINDPTRLVTYTATRTLCDHTFFNTSKTWVRFVAPGGTQIPITSPGENHCGTSITGWMNGNIPGIGALANVSLCWTYSSNCSWKDPLQIVNCEDYYVYGLQTPGGCDFRFCTV